MLINCLMIAIKIESRRPTRTPIRTPPPHRRMERRGKWRLATADRQTRIATRRTRSTPTTSWRPYPTKTCSKAIRVMDTHLPLPINRIETTSKWTRLVEFGLNDNWIMMLESVALKVTNGRTLKQRRSEEKDRFKTQTITPTHLNGHSENEDPSETRAPPTPSTAVSPSQLSCLEMDAKAVIRTLKEQVTISAISLEEMKSRQINLIKIWLIVSLGI